MTSANRHEQPEAVAPPAWHSLTADEVARRWHTNASGLSWDEVERRRGKHGRNVIASAPGKTALRRLLDQFDNILIYVLLGSAVVTGWLGHAADTAVILGVVVVNAIIGILQEGKAEASLDAIRRMITPRASVLRDGNRVVLQAEDLVPGDILILEAGDRVTADVRLTKARNLRIDEAILTGESVPVAKDIATLADTAALADRKPMAYSGTLVTAGQGMGVVVATGAQTELGRISALLSDVAQLETPLIRQLNAFATHLTWAILALSAVTLAFAVLVRDYTLDDAFMAVVGMAVAAIPEGLPAVMTITLALGVQRMASRNAIIRKLPAVETLGSISIICSDKTGTLTRNEMTVTRVVVADAVYDVEGVGYKPDGGFLKDGQTIAATGDRRLITAGRIALLCNDASLTETGGAFSVSGDPMEGALVAFGLKTGLDEIQQRRQFTRLDEIPFDAAHRYMATLHRDGDGNLEALVKGAPEQLLDMSAYQATAAGDVPLDKAYWLRAIEGLAGQGSRVLALARVSIPSAKSDLSSGDLDHGLTLVALVGLIDPPRAEAIRAIADCHSAGIAVKMITGDHAATASAIARPLGLRDPDVVLTGNDLERLDAERFAQAVAQTNVFARTTPEHKLRLVEALQAGGAVIAMTGDGVNDAPALKRADVGVAMGINGTEAAKEVSDMVLADDNFASIVSAVREGRTVYDNLTKVIGWTLPTNGGETVIVAAAILFGLSLPMTPVQILWVNMVTAAGLGLVLAFEPPEDGVMQRRPRKADTPILPWLLVWRVIFVSLLFAIGAFGMFAWAQMRGQSEELARTLVVNTVVVMEIFYLFSVRYAHGSSASARGVQGTRAVLIGVGAVALLQIAFTYLPVMQRIFGTQSLSLVEGTVILSTGVVLFGMLEIEKLLIGNMGRRWRW